MIAWCCTHKLERERSQYVHAVCFRNTWSRDEKTCVDKDKWAMKNMEKIKHFYVALNVQSECLAIGLGGSFIALPFTLERV